MEKFRQYKIIIIIGLVVLGVTFYWFQLRPVSIKKNCSWVDYQPTDRLSGEKSIETVKIEASKNEYETCLREHGL